MEILIERSDPLFVPQSGNFSAKIGNYQGILGLDATKVTAYLNGNKYMQFVYLEHVGIQTYGHSFAQYKQLIFNGHGTQILSDIPVLAAFPTPLPGIPMANMRGALSSLAQDCTRSAAFTNSIGEDLGILKPETSAKPEEGMPNLTVKLTTGGHPILHATKGEYQGYQVWRDGGDGKGYVLIGVSLYADYVDNSSLPDAGTNKQWKYKAIYVQKGAVIGKWSAEVSIMVYGTV